MIRIIFCFAILGFASNAAHAANARIEMVRGDVKVERLGKRESLKEKAEIQEGDFLEGDAAAFIRVRSKSQEISVIGPFSVRWGSDKDGISQVQLDRGKLRMQMTSNRASSKRVRVAVKTPSAVMGVRGTDFFASYEPLLGESEVICFEHEIELSSGSSRVGVKAGYWGGVGGRFGKKIGSPMKLPENVLAHFRGLLPME